MVKLLLRQLFAEKFRAIIRLFYSRFTETETNITHRVDLILDREKGLAMSPTLDTFLQWVEWADTSIREAFLGDHLLVSKETLSKLFAEGQEIPMTSGIESLVSDPELDSMKENAFTLIKNAYAFFSEKSMHASSLLKQLQERLDELDKITSYPEDFAVVSREISELLPRIDSLQRVASFGALHSDMKLGKIMALERMRRTSERMKTFGIKRSQELFDQIWQLKNAYIRSVSTIRMMNLDEDTQDILDLKVKIHELCLLYLPVAETVLLYWRDSTSEIVEQMGTVQDIMTMVALEHRSQKRKKAVQK
jgi:hypothetical protein